MNPNLLPLEPAPQASFYRHPSQNMTTVGITGSAGKTTTAWLVRAILETVGQDCGLIGSTGYELGSTRFTPNVRTRARPGFPRSTRSAPVPGAAPGSRCLFLLLVARAGALCCADSSVGAYHHVRLAFAPHVPAFPYRRPCRGPSGSSRRR